MIKRVSKSFGATSLIWVAFGCLLALRIEDSSTRFQYLKSFGLLSTLCLMNLFFLGKTVASLLEFVSDTDIKARQEKLVSLAVWGSLKFLTLGAIVVILTLMDRPPTLSLVLGVGTMFIVPVLSGLYTMLTNPVD